MKTIGNMGALNGVMINKLDYTSEFESHWVLSSYGHVRHLSIVNYENNWKREHLGWCNDKLARLANLHEWAWVSLFASVIWPCTTSKQEV